MSEPKQENFFDCECATWARDGVPLMTKHHPNCHKYKPKMIKVWTITPAGFSSCTEKETSAVISWIEEMEPGDEIKIKVKEMDEAVFNEMPEYMGP